MEDHGEKLLQVLSSVQKPLHRCLTAKPITSLSFFGPPGRWDPFSELVATTCGVDWSFAAMKRGMERFWRPPVFNSTPIRFDQNALRDGVHSMSMNLNGCLPEDVNVSVNDKVVTVEAKMERKADGSRLYQEFTQEYTLPGEVDTKSLKHILDKAGILRIEASLDSKFQNPGFNWRNSTGEIQAESETPCHLMFT